jgi:hypothetical protein
MNSAITLTRKILIYRKAPTVWDLTAISPRIISIMIFMARLRIIIWIRLIKYTATDMSRMFKQTWLYHALTHTQMAISLLRSFFPLGHLTTHGSHLMYRGNILISLKTTSSLSRKTIFRIIAPMPINGQGLVNLNV